MAAAPGLRWDAGRMASGGKATTVDALLEALWDAKGTDLLLTVGAYPLIRVDGALRPVEGAERPLGSDDTAAALRELLSDRQLEAFAETHELDFSFSWRDNARIRGNAFRQRGNVAVALRMIPRDIPSFDDLGTPAIGQRFAEMRQGLVFVTGPTGAGKSTTLAAIVPWINQTGAVHVVTIEDPIEYVHDHAVAAVNQRE